LGKNVKKIGLWIYLIVLSFPKEEKEEREKEEGKGERKEEKREKRGRKGGKREKGGGGETKIN
jgi:hypothetical protein